MSRSSGTTRRRRRHGQPAACEAKRYAICGIENHGFRGVTNGRTRNWQAMQSGTHFAKTDGFRSHGTRLFHACWGAAPIPAEHRICVLERWIRPRGLRILRLAASSKAQSLHRSSSPHKATALRGTPSIGCAIFQIACGRAAQRCSASFSRRSFASSCSLSSSRIRSILALAVSSSFISSRAFR